ncbi:MAG: alpha/beta fold hydrolase [Planctomycetes bacterium]|nr:alpha/beta fold hydrolase [Planctomycetota bacterium]
MSGTMAAAPGPTDVVVTGGGVSLPGSLTTPRECRGTVVFAHGSGSSRLSSRNIAVAQSLADRGCATLLFDLLTPGEASDRTNVFDIVLLGDRVLDATNWLAGRRELGGLPVGYFGASTGAAAALVAAARLGDQVSAVVSRGGRPDLAGDALRRVTAPTLFLVGSYDGEVLRLNRQAREKLKSPSELKVIEGAGHLFEEPGTLEQVAEAAGSWFVQHFAARTGQGDEPAGGPEKPGRSPVAGPS